ncbi:RNase H domain-containing protein [Trichonephila clavipes]|nr:RNase H domain-containing protein [Trichonephila clavipes]
MPWRRRVPEKLWIHLIALHILSCTLSENILIKKTRLGIKLTWYQADSPGGSHSTNCVRCTQTAVSRFLSGHLRSLAFQGGHKVHEICPKCNTEQASPTHILGCLGLSYDDLLGLRMLVYDFLRVNKLIDLVQQKLNKEISNNNYEITQYHI